MWIIASIPFFLLGGCALVVPLLAMPGFIGELRRNDMEEAGRSFGGSITLLICSGVCLVIAAKIAS